MALQRCVCSVSSLASLVMDESQECLARGLQRGPDCMGMDGTTYGVAFVPKTTCGTVCVSVCIGVDT